MSYAVWYWYHKSVPYEHYNEFPYQARSPVTNQTKEYKNKEDIWEDVQTLVLEDPSHIGINLFHLVPMFSNPSKIVDQWMLNMINDYNLVKRFNVPLKGDLDTVDAHIMDCFIIIENEMTNIDNYEREKALKGGRK